MKKILFVIAIYFICQTAEAKTYIKSGLIAGYDQVKSVKFFNHSNGNQQSLEVFSDTKQTPREQTTEDISTGAAIAIGHRLNDWLIELEYQYIYRFDLNGYYFLNQQPVLFETEIQTDLLFVSIGREFTINNKSYVKTLIGFGRSFIDTETRDWRDWSLTQENNEDDSFKINITYFRNYTNNWHYYLGYQYANIGSFTANLDGASQQTIVGDYQSHGITFGIQYHF